MPERNIDHGKFGARGIKGAEAAARQLDRLAGGISTPVEQKRGLNARLNYLLRSERSRKAAQEAGMPSERTVKAWREGKRKPSKASLRKVEQAYQTVRRQNVARSMKARLNRAGRGTRVELHPQNQSQVDRRYQRHTPYRTLNVRDWDGLVDAWAGHDSGRMDQEWETIIGDLGSDWGQYEYVSNVGFAA
ncbi:transcriptional regulator [Streptomyces sp. B-S-A8]|uniref:Transcriptional regulator n=1 Tax=Streptomyces solicavernae TaxID=3043614 RepID=A0ABT6S1B9_9ACTN|nr:transcriptional regulator [Streptomyces sp. B-S-A8]MDI3390457.1 transcriptional regulator [Streptomyces sp. B-S-A8]